MERYFKTNFGKFILFIIYLISSLTYIIRLDYFNAEIENYSFIKIVISVEAQHYLFGAALFLAAGAMYLAFLYKYRWEVNLYDYALITLLILAGITIVLMFLIIYEIQNPILRAFLVVYVIGFVALQTNNS